MKAKKIFAITLDAHHQPEAFIQSRIVLSLHILYSLPFKFVKKKLETCTIQRFANFLLFKLWTLANRRLTKLTVVATSDISGCSSPSPRCSSVYVRFIDLIWTDVAFLSTWTISQLHCTHEISNIVLAIPFCV